MWALQKEAIRNGSFVADNGPSSSFIRDIAFGVVGFVVLVLIGMFSHKMYNRHKSRASKRRHRSSRGRSRTRSSKGRSSRYDDYDDYDDEGESTFSPYKESVASSQSYEYSLEDGIASPKSPSRKHKRRVPQPSEADSSAFSGEYDDVENSVVDQMTKTVASFIDEQPKRVRREIFAPAGKLGIIVDTSSEGPIVHSIKNDSPLVGKVFTGDYIIAVDDEDVSDWSAHYVTKLVARKSGSVRKLTLLSNQWDD